MTLSTSSAGLAGISRIARCASFFTICVAVTAQQDERTVTTIGNAGLMVATEPTTQTVLALDDQAGGPMVTRRFDGATFNNVATAGPSLRALGAFSACSSTEMVMFGGTPAGGGTPLGDTWRWNGSAWTQLTPAIAPAPRFGAAIAQLPSGAAMLFGGASSSAPGAVLGDTWFFDGSNWTTPTSNPVQPSARVGASMCPDGNGNLLLFGGLDASGAFLSDTWQFDGVNWTQLVGVGQPPARAYAGMDLDALPTLAGLVRNDVVLMGGLSSGTIQDVWRFRNGAWAVVPGLIYNSASTFVTAATDAVRDTVVAVDAVISLPAASCGSRFTTFGAGCGFPMTLAGDDIVVAGGNLTLTIDATGFPNAFLFVSFDPAAAPGAGFPTPWPGCARFVGNAAGVSGTVGLALTGAGTGTLTVTASYSTALIGTRINYQAADFAVNSLSNALEVRVGN
ncbi:MAG: kelch repeat-containing protein [Planctomycetota bacterium]